MQRNPLAVDSDLYIFSDGPKKGDEEKIEEIREYIKNLNGFKSVNIIEREINYGLANSVISGVTEIIERYKSVIVLEDDIVTAPNFLSYMNKCLSFYGKSHKIESVTGYRFPFNLPLSYKEDLFLYYRPSSWGWGTWSDRWEGVDWKIENYKEIKRDLEFKNTFIRGGEDLLLMLDNQMNGYIDSWAIRWCYHHYKKDTYSLYPTKSLVKNIGMDYSGTHCKPNKKFNTIDKMKKKDFIMTTDIELSQDVILNLSKFFEISKFEIIKNTVKNWMRKKIND